MSDRGTAFTSEEFRTYLENLKITHVKIAVGAPWANGQVERVNRFLRSTLAKESNSISDWYNKLNKVQFVINDTWHKSIKTSPSKLMLGYEMREVDDESLRDYIDTYQQVIQDFDLERQVYRDKAIISNSLMQTYNKKCTIKGTKPQENTKRVTL